MLPRHRHYCTVSMLYKSSTYSVYYNIFTIYNTIVQAHLWRQASATKYREFPKSRSYWAAMLMRARFAYKTQTLWNFNSQSSQTTIQLPACIQKVINAAKAGQESAINPLSAFSEPSLLAQYTLNFISMIWSKDRVWRCNIPDKSICLVIIYFALNQLSLWQYSVFSM